LKDIEGALSSLSGSQESNVTEIVHLVQESKEIAQKQKVTLYQSFKNFMNSYSEIFLIFHNYSLIMFLQSILKGNALQQMVEIVLEAFQSSESEVYLDDLGLEHLMMGLANIKDLKLDKDPNKEMKVKREFLSSDRSLKGILGIVNVLSETSGIGDEIQ